MGANALPPNLIYTFFGITPVSASDSASTGAKCAGAGAGADRDSSELCFMPLDLGGGRGGGPGGLA